MCVLHPHYRGQAGSAPTRCPVHHITTSPPPSTTAAPALPPLHPPPLPRAPCRLSPSSSTLHPTGQPLRRARGLPLAKARAKPASPTPAPVSRVGVESQALARPDGARGPGIATPQNRRASFSFSSSSRGCSKHPLPLVCACVSVCPSVSGAVRPAEVRNLLAVLVCLPSWPVCLAVPLATCSERHVAAVGRLSSVGRSRVARMGALAGSLLPVCVRARDVVLVSPAPLVP